jgi:hypothetical protein
VDARQNLDQRALARPVFSGEDVDLAGVQIERNPIEHPVGTEALSNAGELKQILGHVRSGTL